MVTDLVLEPDRAGLLEAMSAASQSGAGSQPTRVEYRCRRKDGYLLWLEGCSTPVREEGPVPVVDMVRDITTRKALVSDLVAALLAPLGAEVRRAESAAVALELAALTAFDLILMDLRMPAMDGREALRALRAALGPNQDTPVLAFFADVIPELAGSLASEGFAGAAGKPVDLAEFLSAVTKLAQDEKGAGPAVRTATG